MAYIHNVDFDVLAQENGHNPQRSQEIVMCNNGIKLIYITVYKYIIV